MFLVDIKKMFPPTREWTSEARNKILIDRKVDAVIIVTPGASSSSVIPVATQTYGSYSGTYTGSTYGSTTSGTVNMSGTSTSYNIMSARSEAEFSAILFDVRESRVAWYADIFTKAGGTLFVSGKGDAKAAAKGVIKGLIENGHLKKK